MLAAVEFDDQPAFQANEIDDIRADGMLAAELAAHEGAVAQMVPDGAFGVGHGSPQMAGESGFPSFAHAPRSVSLARDEKLA